MSDKHANHSSHDEPPFKDGASSFGSFYPKHYVLAVFPDDAVAGQAAGALRAAGFAADDVVYASGAEVVAHARDAKAGQGAVTRLGEQWSRLFSDGTDASRHLVDQAIRGAAFVLAYAPEDEHSIRAAAALRPLQPDVFCYYGTFTVTDLH